jgi:hypothetical protein
MLLLSHINDFFVICEGWIILEGKNNTKRKVEIYVNNNTKTLGCLSIILEASCWKRVLLDSTQLL